jgi:hypothetical protein
MKTSVNRLTVLLLIMMTASMLSFDLPKGWFKAGSNPESYDMGIDKGAGKDGKNAATIKSTAKKIRGFGTLMQNCAPNKYFGKRVRMSGLMKTKEVAKWAGFWFRIDAENSNKSLGFDNMKDGKKDRSVKGTTEWTKYEIVLDVPDSSSNLAYGALLVGKGQIWFDDIQFEIVDNSVPTTGKGISELMPNEEPVNLNFEE